MTMKKVFTAFDKPLESGNKTMIDLKHDFTPKGGIHLWCNKNPNGYPTGEILKFVFDHLPSPPVGMKEIVIKNVAGQVLNFTHIIYETDGSLTVIVK